MSWQPATEPVVERAPCPALEAVIVPRPRDIGGLEVRRVLPSAQRRAIGPFVFLDQMGPVTFSPGTGLDVRPHPHIGLATVTYLFTGEILHRDSLGNVQRIRPGEVNWMTAGKGIVHSERTPPELRTNGNSLSGIQSWVALPSDDEEAEPDFVHHGTDDLPLIEGESAQVRLIAGSLWGRRSPVRIVSELFYADATFDARSSLILPNGHGERAVYIVEGAIVVGGESFDAGRLLVFRAGDEIPIQASTRSRAMLLGGAPLDRPRHLWWNFVSTSKERIERAKADWRARRFPPLEGESEFIPLPE